MDNAMDAFGALLSQMVDMGASDLYMISGHPPVLRVDDTLRHPSEAVLSAQDTQAIATAIMSPEQNKQFAVDWEMNLSYHMPGLDRFRCNIFRQKGETALVLRRISSNIPDIEALRLPSILRKFIMEKRGLVLVAGATGSGKSTTMAAMLGYRNDHVDGHIITIEDPIEYFFSPKKSLISQREIGIDTQSFSVAMKQALRQSPDVLMVGEMRDAESVKMAIDFAETGHLVVSTLHAPNATQTIQRMLQYFPESMHAIVCLQLSQNLKGIISQRLLPRKEGDGRMIATEVLPATPRIRTLIKEQNLSELKGAMENSHELGIHTFDQSLYTLYKKNEITEEVALAHADSPNNLKLKLKGLASASITIEPQ